MIIIPTGTDAPIYHWPYMTVAVMVLNVACFVAVPPASSVAGLDDNDEVVEAVASELRPLRARARATACTRPSG